MADRRKLLATIHVAKKQLALDETSYRGLVSRLTGHESAGECTPDQLEAVVAEFRRLGAPRSMRSDERPMAKRLRALWLAAWNLDAIDDPSESALQSFVRRQTGRERLQFCSAEKLSLAIEGVKAICTRGGFDAAPGLDPLEARRRLVRCQWQVLHAAGWAKVAGDRGLAGYAHTTWCIPNARAVVQMEAPHLDKLAALLGRRVRELKLGRRHKAEGAT